MNSKVKSKAMKQIMMAIVGVWGILYFVTWFQMGYLMSLPLPVRMILMPIIYWLIALVPAAIMIHEHEKMSDYGMYKDKWLIQIVLGIVAGVAMSVVLTLVPILLGYGEAVCTSYSYSQPWQFVYQIFYDICAIALVEELIFRGFFYAKIRELCGNTVLTMVLSSVLFGFFHIFGGGLTQVIVTALIGMIFCVLKDRIKHFSLLSLVIAHGLYDWFIILWTSTLQH